MEKKIVFIDVDGTLVGERGTVPDSAKKACTQARKNGHLLYLCTGRSKAELYDFILEVGFDGIIGAGGGFVEIDNEILFHKKFEVDDVKDMVDYFKEHGINFYLESNGGLFGSENLRTQLNELIDLVPEEHRESTRTHMDHFVGAMKFGESLYRDDMNKACFLENKAIPFEQIKKAFGEKFGVIQCTVPMFGENSGEIMIPNIHKATAIEVLLEHLGMTQEQTIAIGDGLNDLEMLEFCAVGIAMGNAKEGLKDIADHITQDVDNHGLYESFKKYQLI